MSRSPRSRRARINQALSFINTFLLIFAGIALFVGSFLIVNTFSILVAQRSRELALFRALGAARRQVTRSVLFEAFVVGLVGATLGLGLGFVLALGIKALFATFGLDLSGSPLVFEWPTAMWSYAVGLVVTMVAAYLPARRAGKMPPVAAMRDDVALPESALRWRLLVGTVLMVGGLVAGYLGAFTEHRQLGLLRRRRCLRAAARGRADQPGHRSTGDRRLRLRLPTAVQDRRGHGRAERHPQPAAHGRHRLGAHDRPDPGLDDVGVRGVGQGQRRQVDRGELRRRLRRVQRHRPAVLVDDHRGRGQGPGRRGGHARCATCR